MDYSNVYDGFPDKAKISAQFEFLLMLFLIAELKGGCNPGFQFSVKIMWESRMQSE